jgi:hypothetical protein
VIQGDVANLNPNTGKKMKQLTILNMISLLITLILLAACGADSVGPGGDDDDNNMNGTTVDPGVMTMKVNDIQWTPAQVEGAVLIPNTVLSLTASVGNLASALLLVVSDVNGVGVRSYPLATDVSSGLDRSFSGGYSQAVTTDSIFVAEPDSANPQGTLTITEVDFQQQFISGTFSLQMVIDDGSGRVIRITEGQFNRISFGG